MAASSATLSSTVEIGFANLPNQIHRVVAAQGFHFNVLVVGKSGLGKSTFINSLFASEIYEEDTELPMPGLRIPSTTSITEATVKLQENGVPLHLTIVDTPGYGMGINNDKCWRPIVEEIDHRFDRYEQAESQLQRSDIADPRIHCCLYFIEPCFHGLKALDLQTLRSLQYKVNIIPIIAKADSLTVEECAVLKKRILDTLAANGISIYKFPDAADDPDAEDDVLVKQAQNALPFAICSKKRVYPWGTVDAEKPEHSDFALLRDLVLRTYTQQLIDATNDVHYERYRSNKLVGLSLTTSMKRSSKLPPMDSNIMHQLEQERSSQAAKLQQMEREMTAVFESKVKSQEEKLRKEEEDIKKEHDTAMAKLKERQQELQARREEYEKEKQEYDTKKEEAGKKKGFRLH